MRSPGSEPVLQPRHLRRDRIEDAPVLARLREPLRRRAAVAKQALEDGARVVLGRQRRRRRPPRQRVHVDAAVAVPAVADQIVQVEAQLERRQRRILAEHRRRDLIGGDAVVHVGAFGVLRVHAGEPGARAARVVAVGAVVRRVGVVLGQPAEDDHLILERRQRRQDRRQLEVGRPRPSASSSSRR